MEVDQLSQQRQTDAEHHGTQRKIGRSRRFRRKAEEYTLKAGTYTFTLYVKGDGQVRPGYAIVEANGSIAGGDSYKYGGYTSTTAGEWTKVTYEFTLTEQTKVNLKTTSYATASEKLVDDASLTTTDGGIVG